MLPRIATNRPAMKTLLILATTLPLLACTATLPDEPVGPRQVAQGTPAGSEPRVVCSREIPTGTMMAVTRCRNVEDMATRSQSDRENAEKVQTTVPDSVLGR